MLVRPRPTPLLAACALALLVSTTPANAGARYTLTNLTASNGVVSANGINNAGQIVGSFLTDDGERLPFLYSNGAMTDLGAHGNGVFGEAYAINDAGQIVGGDVNTYALGVYQAYLYSNGSVTFLGEIHGDVYSYAVGINNAGQVIGTIDAGHTSSGFLYSNGSLTELDTLGGFRSFALGINASGQVVGSSQIFGGDTHAVLYSNGSMTDLGTFGGQNSWATAINDAGQVVGSSQTIDGNDRAFLYDNGSMTDLGTLGGDDSAASGINNAGQIVGSSSPYSRNARAFLYEGGTMIDLNTLIDPVPGLALRNATAINDQGQILATGVDARGDYSVFLLTPNVVPEPSSIVLMGLGLAGLAGVALRRRGRTPR